MSADLFEHLADRLAGVLGVPIVDTDPTGLAVPYGFLWGPGGSADAAAATLAGGPDSLALGVTVVGRVPYATRQMAAAVRSELTPDSIPATFIHGDAHVTVRHSDSRPVQVDRDVTLEESNTHPCFAVELFDLLIQPIPEVSP